VFVDRRVFDKEGHGAPVPSLRNWQAHSARTMRKRSPLGRVQGYGSWLARKKKRIDHYAAGLVFPFG
jgi:hypothetical protein